MVDAIFPIVEGHGEVSAVPVLLRRMAHEVFQNYQFQVLSPFRLPRAKIQNRGDLQKAVELGARKLAMQDGVGAILVLLDADDECPARLGPRLLGYVRQARNDVLSSVVVAKSEFESWFLAAAVSLRGKGAIRRDAVPPVSPETIRDAKGYLERHLFRANSKYSETVDQASLTAEMSLNEARHCPSFDKFYREMERLFR